jgi:BolA family transcriptional regulator, general stress-responsive regulator
MSAIDILHTRLASLEPTALDIRDDSARHAGHAGAKSGGHFVVDITSSHFAGRSTMQRHRLVYDAVSDLMQQGIHALSIKARTPEETQP